MGLVLSPRPVPSGHVISFPWLTKSAVQSKLRAAGLLLGQSNRGKLQLAGRSPAVDCRDDSYRRAAAGALVFDFQAAACLLPRRVPACLPEVVLALILSAGMQKLLTMYERRTAICIWPVWL